MHTTAFYDQIMPDLLPRGAFNYVEREREKNASVCKVIIFMLGIQYMPKKCAHEKS